jgi:type IV pilus assembly protein PilB
MANTKTLLGQLLVEAKIIEPEQLDEVLARQKQDRRRLGTLLIESGLVSEAEITQLLSLQLSVPWVSLYHVDFSRQLLNLVPRELAEKFCLVPIFVRRVPELGETLYVAMDDPLDEMAIKEVSAWAGLPVRTMIAPPSDIRGAIRAYYYGSDRWTVPPVAAAPAKEDASPRASAERTEERAARAVEFADSALAKAERVDPPAEPAPHDSYPQIEAREIDMPMPKGAAARMVTITLLDGTQINLPARPAAPLAERAEALAVEGEQLTARDLVLALRLVGSGDASRVLGENVRWERLFAALLAVLLKKHLVADWEFVEEYRLIG